MGSTPMVEETQRLPDFSYARYAELVGLEGIHVDDPGALGDAFDRAFSARRPVVVDVVTDPEVPPLPPHVELEQATSMLKAVLSGDQHSKRMISQGFKGKLQEFIRR
jgi:pyruvate dehydrogenase (quinone)